MWPFRSKGKQVAAKSRHPSDFGPFSDVFGPGTRYLSLLHLMRDEAQNCCNDISGIVESNEDASDYIRLMLADVNWRPHLVACVAALTSPDRNEYAGLMWAAIDAGSWVAPQLAVTLSFCDSDFVENAKQRILEGCPVSPPSGLSMIERHSFTGPAGTPARSGKNMASLIEVLSSVDGDSDWVSSVRTESGTRKLLKEDFDNSAEIARSWLKKIRTTLEPLGVSFSH